MPPGLQAKLLRFLEERSFRRVGGTKEISVDVRVISATNRDIEKAIEERHFRSDLMFRLNVIPIYLPPLCERGDDIKLLAQHFVATFAQEFRKTITHIDDAAYEKLGSYPWPGNVRELRNVMERAVLLAKGDSLGADDIAVGRPGSPDKAQPDGFTLPPAGLDLREMENRLIRQALEQASNNQTEAAKLLNLSRDAFRYRMEKLGLL